MLLPRPIANLLAVFRGSVSPVCVFFSVLLGFWFGLMPGWSGLHTVLVVVVLVLNIHTGLFLLTAVLGKAVCLAAAPVLYHVGVFVQANLSPVLRVFGSIPVIGLTDFANYALDGALVLGPVLGVICGLLLALAVVRFRKMMLRLEEGSETFRKWYSRRWVILLDRILIGKRTKDIKSLFAVKTPILRKAGVILAVLVIGAGAWAAVKFRNETVRTYAADRLTQVNGAQVDVNGVDISLSNGRVGVDGIQMTDAKNPAQNQFAVGKIAAQTSMYDLTVGRLIMEKVEVSGVRFNQPRTSPGKVTPKPEPNQPPFDPWSYKIDPNQINKLEKYFADAKKLKEWLKKVQQRLPASDKAAKKQVPQGYLEYLKARADVPATPRLMAKEVLLGNVLVPSTLFGDSQITMQNISDAMAAAKLPVSLDMKSNQTGASVNLTMDYSRGANPGVSGTFGGLDLGKLQTSLGKDAGVAFDSGTASGTFTGQMSREQVDLMLNVRVQNLKAKTLGQGLLGLTPQQTSEILDVLKDLNTTIRLVGPASDLRVVFDTKGLGQEFKNALVKAGKERLIREVDEKLGKQIDEKLGDKVPQGIRDVLKQKPKDIVEGLGGLLGGKKDKTQKDPNSNVKGQK